MWNALFLSLNDCKVDLDKEELGILIKIFQYETENSSEKNPNSIEIHIIRL